MKTRTPRLVVTGVVAASAVGLVLLLLSSARAAPLAAPRTWSDGFDSSTLDGRWSWIGEDDSHWSLTDRPGFLRITLQQSGMGPGAEEKNLLVQTGPAGDFEIETHLLFTPTQNFEMAGLLVYQADDTFLMLGRAYCGFVPPCVGNGIYFDHVEQGTYIGTSGAMTTTLDGEAYLRIVRHGAVYSGYVSENGADWTLVQVHTAVSDLVPSMVGLATSTGNQDVAQIPADFDTFSLVDNSLRVQLPLTLRDF